MAETVGVIPRDKLTPSTDAVLLYGASALILWHKIIWLLVEALSNFGSQPPLYWKAISGNMWPD